MSELLELRGIHASYGRVQVLHGIDLTVRRGAVTALLGCNGAGKTTLLRSITASISYTGVARFADQDITRLRTHQIARAGIATVPADRGTITGLSVEENLRIGATTLRRGIPFTDRFAAVAELFPVLREMSDRPAELLSGGQQQMLAIARALMNEPRLLILDEPSQGLASIIVQQIFGTVRRLATAGLTVLIAEQNATASLRIADDATVIADGRVVTAGAADTIRSSTSLSNAYLGTAQRRE
ncbi:ABC transporter ATP-binding protein [Nocardia sp. NPDC052278]|uniref:ABC transporter ATP-binding protein n=1 Tax=unclassified Nocardia TaxID=2637762 RepID=UPI00369162E7